MPQDETAKPSGRLYSIAGGDHDRPADWLVVRARDGRTLWAFLSREEVERFASLHPGRTFKVIQWSAGRPDWRYLVQATWSRRIRWAVRPVP